MNSSLELDESKGEAETGSAAIEKVDANDVADSLADTTEDPPSLRSAGDVNGEAAGEMLTRPPGYEQPRAMPEMSLEAPAKNAFFDTCSLTRKDDTTGEVNQQCVQGITDDAVHTGSEQDPQSCDGLQEQRRQNEGGAVDDLPSIESTSTPLDILLGESEPLETKMTLHGQPSSPLKVSRERIEVCFGHDDVGNKLFPETFDEKKRMWSIEASHHQKIAGENKASSLESRVAADFLTNTYAALVVAKILGPLDHVAGGRTRSVASDVPATCWTVEESIAPSLESWVAADYLSLVFATVVVAEMPVSSEAGEGNGQHREEGTPQSRNPTIGKLRLQNLHVSHSDGRRDGATHQGSLESVINDGFVITQRSLSTSEAAATQAEAMSLPVREHMPQQGSPSSYNSSFVEAKTLEVGVDQHSSPARSKIEHGPFMSVESRAAADYLTSVYAILAAAGTTELDNGMSTQASVLATASRQDSKTLESSSHIERTSTLRANISTEGLQLPRSDAMASGTGQNGTSATQSGIQNESASAPATSVRASAHYRAVEHSIEQGRGPSTVLDIAATPAPKTNSQGPESTGTFPDDARGGASFSPPLSSHRVKITGPVESTAVKLSGLSKADVVQHSVRDSEEQASAGGSGGKLVAAPYERLVLAEAWNLFDSVLSVSLVTASAVASANARDLTDQPGLLVPVDQLTDDVLAHREVLSPWLEEASLSFSTASSTNQEDLQTTGGVPPAEVSESSSLTTVSAENDIDVVTREEDLHNAGHVRFELVPPSSPSTIELSVIISYFEHVMKQALASIGANQSPRGRETYDDTDGPEPSLVGEMLAHKALSSASQGRELYAASTPERLEVPHAKAADINSNSEHGMGGATVSVALAEAIEGRPHLDKSASTTAFVHKTVVTRHLPGTCEILTTPERRASMGSGDDRSVQGVATSFTWTEAIGTRPELEGSAPTMSSLHTTVVADYLPRAYRKATTEAIEANTGADDRRGVDGPTISATPTEKLGEQQQVEVDALTARAIHTAVVEDHFSGANGKAAVSKAATGTGVETWSSPPEIRKIGDKPEHIPEVGATCNQHQSSLLPLYSTQTASTETTTPIPCEDKSTTSRSQRECRGTKSSADDSAREAASASMPSLPPRTLDDAKTSFAAPTLECEELKDRGDSGTLPPSAAISAAVAFDYLTGTLGSILVSKECALDERVHIEAQVLHEKDQNREQESRNDRLPKTFAAPTSPDQETEPGSAPVKDRLLPSFVETLSLSQDAKSRSHPLPKQVVERRLNAASWLQDTGKRAKSYQGARLDAVEWLQEVGSHAKSQQESAASAQIDAVTYLCEVGARAKSQQNGADGMPLNTGEGRSSSETTSRSPEKGGKPRTSEKDKSRTAAAPSLQGASFRAIALVDEINGTSTDTAALLHEADVGEMSSQRRFEEARVVAVAWLQGKGARAKYLQDQANEARKDAVDWLKEAGKRAKYQHDRIESGQHNAGRWLQAAGARAKCQQEAHVDALAWLRETGTRAKLSQENAAGIRLEALEWLQTRGKAEIQRLQLVQISDVVAQKRSLDSHRVVEERDSTTEAKNSLEQRESKADSLALSSSKSNQSLPSIASPSALEMSRCESMPALLTNNDKDASAPDVARECTNNDDSAASDERFLIESASTSADVFTKGAERTRRLPSADRTAPAMWLEPALAPLPREGSVAPTEPAAEGEGLTGMLEVGGEEWARVSLSRTPPFDALNSPSLALRWAPVGGRPRPVPPNAESFNGTVSSAIVGDEAKVGGHEQRRVLAAGEGRKSESGCGMMPAIPGGSEWVDFFAPPHRMAPAGDAYGIDTFRSADASASTTVRGNSTGNLIPSHASDCTADGGGGNRGNDQRWSVCGGLEKSWGLGNVRQPVAEAKRRMTGKKGECFGEKEGCFDSLGEETKTSFTSSRCTRGKKGNSRKWSKAAERSRQYIRRWETFLSQVHRHFDGEAQLRKRLSAIRRAHPDVSNEVAFVVLAQSRGSASEAAAVLHLPRAKDEANLVTMMLDVRSFIALAREAVEERRRLRHLEYRRPKTTTANHTKNKDRHDQQHQLQQWDTHQPPMTHCMRQQEQQHQMLGHRQERRREVSLVAGDTEAFEDFGGGVGGGSEAGQTPQRWGEPTRARQDQLRPRKFTDADHKADRCDPGSRGSGSAPALLPPLVGLVAGTPPSPKTLRTVLSTATSVAPGIPAQFGLSSELEGAQVLADVPEHGTSDMRENRERRRARARHQRQKMAEISSPGGWRDQKSGWSLDALTERFIRETRTLARDSEYLDTHLRQAQRGPSYLGRSSKKTLDHSSSSRSSLTWIQGPSPASLESASNVTGSAGAKGVAASSGEAPSVNVELPAAGGDLERRSCRLQSYFTQALGDVGLATGGRVEKARGLGW